VVASNGIAFMQSSMKLGLVVERKGKQHGYVISRLFLFREKSGIELEIFPDLSEFKMRYNHFHFHHVICLRTASSVVSFHTVRSCASPFNFQYTLVSLR
jgi:hypothetical protein